MEKGENATNRKTSNGRTRDQAGMTGRDRALAALDGLPVDRVPRYADLEIKTMDGRMLGDPGVKAQISTAMALGLDMTRQPARPPQLRNFQSVEELGAEGTAALVMGRYRECCAEAADGLLPLLEFPYSIFGPLMNGAGAIDTLAALAASPADAAAMLEKTCRLCCAIAEKIASCGGVDALLFMDDLAGSQGPLVSPETLRALYFPRLREVLQTLKPGAKRVVFHSDGDLRAIHRDIAAAGADGHHPVEPVGGWSLSEASLSCRIVIGNGSLGKILSSARAAAAEGRRCLRFGSGRSGYFMAPSSEIPFDLPRENVSAFFAGAADGND